MLKKVNIFIEEDVSKGTKEKRSELRKYMREVILDLIYVLDFPIPGKEIPP